MPSSLPVYLERILGELRESRIDAGVEMVRDNRVRVWIGEPDRGPDRGKGATASFDCAPRLPGQAWPDGDVVARWLHHKALALFPDSAYAQRFRGHA
jgi:hypothetical protein